MNSSAKIPVPTLERLATYLRFLTDLEVRRVGTVSSNDMAKQTGIHAAQFRKDLSYFGEFGKPGVGYSVSELQHRITQILKLDRPQPVIVVGVGNLGSALIGYPGLRENKFFVVGAFDNSHEIIGLRLGDIVIQDEARLADANRRLGARIAILAVPAGSAQTAVEKAIAAGVRVVLNFAPIALRVPEFVTVRNVSFLQELAVLSYHLPDVSR